jgi:acyl-CoA thioesterase-1
VGARRGTQWIAATLAAALVVLVALTSTGTATGADVQRCAGFALQSEARERLTAGHGNRVVVIGDSYSVGLGLRDPRVSWPSRLPGEVQVFGFSGSGFSRGASPCRGVSYDAREPRALRGGADLVVVEGGLNDHDQPTSEVRLGFRRLVERLEGHPVLVVGPAAAPARAAAAGRVDAVLAEESARAGVAYLSMLDHRFEYLTDGLHLTASGHRAFGDVVARVVAD